MDEVHPGPGGAVLRLLVEEAHASLAQRCRHGVDVVHPVAHLLDAGARLGQELADGRVVLQGGQQLDAAARVAHRQHGLAHALLLVDLLVHRVEVEVLGVELEGSEHVPFTPEQYTVLAKLTNDVRERYPAITRDRLTGHSDIAPGRKTDPGPYFDWSLYLSLIGE